MTPSWEESLRRGNQETRKREPAGTHKGVALTNGKERVAGYVKRSV